MNMSNFWDFSVWGPFNLVAVLLLSLLAANLLKKYIPGLEKSLIPSSVLGGGILLVISSVFTLCTGKAMFDTGFFGGNGSAALEIITYHALALGFIASNERSSDLQGIRQRPRLRPLPACLYPPGRAGTIYPAFPRSNGISYPSS